MYIIVQTYILICMCIKNLYYKSKDMDKDSIYNMKSSVPYIASAKTMHNTVNKRVILVLH